MENFSKTTSATIDKISGEVCWARLVTDDGRGTMYIGACYRPEGPAAELDGLAESLEIIDSKNRHGKSTVVLGGDFNSGDINWDLLTPDPTCEKKGICERLISIFGASELVQMQRSSTRQGALLDLFATNRPGLVSEISTIPGISTAGDHEIIVVDSDPSNPRFRRLLRGRSTSGIRPTWTLCGVMQPSSETGTWRARMISL